jgi:hypothetical protein
MRRIRPNPAKIALDVRLTRTGLIACTNAGYYAQPGSC